MIYLVTHQDTLYVSDSVWQIHYIINCTRTFDDLSWAICTVCTFVYMQSSQDSCQVCKYPPQVSEKHFPFSMLLLLNFRSGVYIVGIQQLTHCVVVSFLFFKICLTHVRSLCQLLNVLIKILHHVGIQQLTVLLNPFYSSRFVVILQHSRLDFFLLQGKISKQFQS